MIIAVSALSGALFVCVAMFLLINYVPTKDKANNYKRQFELAEEQLRIFKERMHEERRLADSLEIIVRMCSIQNRYPTFKSVQEHIKDIPKISKDTLFADGPLPKL